MKITSKNKSPKQVSINLANVTPNIVLKDGSTPKIHSFNYETTIKNFEVIPFNRGEKEGFKKIRVRKLSNILDPTIDNGINYLWEYSPIKAMLKKNGMLWVLDGANRIEAIKMLIKEGKLPKDFKLAFTIITDVRLNSLNRKELISVMADLNNHDSRWTEREHFNSAYNAGFKTAKVFNEYLALIKSEKIVNRLTYVTPNQGKRVVNIKYNLLMALATQSRINSNGSSVQLSDFRDNNIGNYMRSNKFIEDFNSLIDLLEHIKDWTVMYNVRASKVLAPILRVMYGKHSTYRLASIVLAMKKVKYEGGNIQIYMSEVTNYIITKL